jgi:hypothetical protein
MRGLAIVVLVVAAVAGSIGTRSAERASGEAGAVSRERWTTLDAVAGVGRFEWSCSSVGSRVRFTAGPGATERLFVRIGSLTRSRALLQRGYALQLPLQGPQIWTIKRLSESLPPVVLIRVVPRGGQGCRPPEVDDHTRRRSFSAS